MLSITIDLNIKILLLTDRKKKTIYRVAQKSRTREKIEYLHCSSSKRADFFINDRDMSKGETADSSPLESSGIKWSQVESSGIKWNQVESSGVKWSHSGVKRSQVES